MRGESQNYNNYVIYKIKHSCVPDSNVQKEGHSCSSRSVDDLANASLIYKCRISFPCNYSISSLYF